MRLRVLRREPRPVPVAPGTEPARVPWSWRRLLRPPQNREVLAALARNPGLKLLSLLLAFVLWYYFNVSERNAEMDVTLPVRIVTVGQGLIVTDVPNKAVTLTLRGPSSMLESVNAQRRRMTVELSGGVPGENRIELGADMIQPELPRRVTVRTIEPSRLVVRAERIEHRRVPVKADLAGQPASGYIVGDVHVTPDTVNVSGPTSGLNGLKEIKTERVPLQRASTQIERSALLSSPGDFFTFAPDRVMVSVTFKEAMMSRVFENVTVTVRNTPTGRSVELTPKSVELTVTGPQTVLSTFAVPAGSVHVDATDLRAGRHRVVPQVDLPQGLEVTRREPEFLNLEIAGDGG